ncbi:MAG TPA: CrcB family protein [Nocardioides sp.]|uniref:fluoride efflux transporter FluC n=1 Tax=Nocardioides sp. TaxID=35761 RepID=UPI002B91C618|nr:CrcB family protein [Nocardioides sp.]HTW16641.1 CrcB family protein [Nocardioides sp.]
MTGLLVALGAAAGSSLRYVVAQRWDGRFPRGTLAVNVLGSLLLGLLAALSVSGQLAALLGTGFCGGFTTYSAFAVQAHGLGPRRGTAYVVVTTVLAMGACALGFWVGS